MKDLRSMMIHYVANCLAMEPSRIRLLARVDKERACLHSFTLISSNALTWGSWSTLGLKVIRNVHKAFRLAASRRVILSCHC